MHTGKPDSDHMTHTVILTLPADMAWRLVIAARWYACVSASASVNSVAAACDEVAGQLEAQGSF